MIQELIEKAVRTTVEQEVSKHLIKFIGENLNSDEIKSAVETNEHKLISIADNRDWTAHRRLVQLIVDKLMAKELHKRELPMAKFLLEIEKKEATISAMSNLIEVHGNQVNLLWERISELEMRLNDKQKKVSNQPPK